MEKVITVESLQKKYKNKLVLNNINLSINEGQVVGLFGKNGAGKTTLNKLLIGLIKPTDGKIDVLGYKAEECIGKVSYLSENISIYPTLSAKDNLKQIYWLDNITPDNERIDELLSALEINNKKVISGKFSLGMKRRLQIAMSTMINTKDIIIMDEPTNGLDLNGVLWLKEQISNLKKQNKTVILTSHAIVELEELLDSYMILDDGIIKDQGEVKLQTKMVCTSSEEDIGTLCKALINNGRKYNIKNKLTAELYIDSDFDFGQAIKLINNNKINLVSCDMQKESLLEKYSKIVGKKND